MIPIRQIFIISLFFALASSSYAQFSGVKNFPKSVYKAANQNWSVDIMPNGFIYFANHKGLLEFDGANWRLYELPQQTILRAVYVDSDSLIYTAGYRELGFWKRSAEGLLEYTSLNRLAEPYFAKNDEFWQITRLGQEVYFQSFGKLLVLKGETVSPVQFAGYVNVMSRVNDNIYVGVSNFGIYALENGTPVPVVLDRVFQNTTIKFIQPFGNNQLLIGTSSKGIFTWDGIALKPWNPSWTEYFRNNEVNRAHVGPDGNFIIGTIIDGIVVFDSEGRFLSHFNSRNGLQNNTVLGIDSDKFGNTWLALDNGIGFISADNSIDIDIMPVADVGSVYDMVHFEGKVYLGTNQGLFYKNLGDAGHEFRLVQEAQGQVWFCKQIDDYLFVGFNGGTLTIKNGVVRQISGQSGGFSMTEDPLRPGSFFISTYNNLVKIQRQGNAFGNEQLVGGFSDLIKHIEFDNRGNLWASHMHRGIYKLQLNPSRDSVISTTYFGQQSAFRKDYSINVFKVENRVVFTTGDSLFTFDDITNSIIPYTFLNRSTGQFAKASRIVAAPDNHYWFITRNALGLFRIFNYHAELINFIPRSIFSNNPLIDDFENIYPTGPVSAIICLENGIATLAFETVKPLQITGFKPLLREVLLSGVRDYDTLTRVENGEITIGSRFQNVKLRYSFPHFTHYPIGFKFKLSGVDSEWSESLPEPVFSFDRLPVGTYQLLVKAVDAWENESMQESITLKVSPPFYLSSWAKRGYFLLAVLLFFGLQNWSIRKTRIKARLKLEKREQELTMLRNEKLSSEVEHKCKELANLTMANVKKNEFLMKLKEILAQQKEQLGSRFPDKYFLHITGKIDENISNTDDWNLFETNFERAHEQFLQKLKDQFPDLTPKDLRLCAFLRMNLSSKEIAPLMGISVRGVENHRYKLRKKMGLNHDENLIEMVMKR